jgi:2-polyprenyl-3-methyl-5-hydroxy-6-metoxy-1,4-benzoquinol methylase
MKQWKDEVIRGERFSFGKNWLKFNAQLTEVQIQHSTISLQSMLECTELQSKTFLDIGSGSGLSSLAAHLLGADVVSFDYDPTSVVCTADLKIKYANEDSNWRIEEGSVLDIAYLKSLGKFDVVYAWGVLHHTGAMWQALENVANLVNPGGKLYISIYNDQGWPSKGWKRVKQLYNKTPRKLRFIVIMTAMIRLWIPRILIDLINYGNPLKTWIKYTKENVRGMSPLYDAIDWVGGYPFEVAKPEEIFEYFKMKGFVLTKLKTAAGGKACNQYVFYKNDN